MRAIPDGPNLQCRPASGVSTTFQEPPMSTVHTFAPRFPPRETVLCLHCSGSSGRQWKPIGAALSARFDVTAPDLLGYGGEPRWPAGTPASLDDEARALAPLLQPAAFTCSAIPMAARWRCRSRCGGPSA